MPNFRALKIGDETKLIPLFKVLTGKEILIDSASLVADTDAVCLVIEENDELIGFGSLIIHQVPTKGEVARLEDIIISEKHQGKGLGRTLVTKLIEIAKEKNIRKINLTSNPMRIGAHKLYGSVGFSRVNTDTFVMEI
ncbi:MAG: GNAT family N-acetyltransferase [Candidatus Moranbacteria bacterium]|nr:GNAT family N-acetyltransferase [Candidatus Moranbacteria bacterium]